MRRKIIRTLAVLLSAGLFFGCVRSPVEVAYIGGFTGENAPIGIETYRAMMLRLKQLKCRRVHIVTANLTESEKVTDVYRSLKDQGIRIYIVGVTSSIMLALEPYIATDDVIVFNIFSAGGELSGKDDRLIRNIPDTRLEAESIADFICRKFPDKTLAILYDTFNSNYTLPELQYLTDRIRRNRPGYSYYSIAVDYDKYDKAAIERISKELNGGTVLLLSGGGTAFKAGGIAQIVRKYNPGAQLVLTPWLDTIGFFKSSGASAEGAYLPSLRSGGDTLIEYAAFVSNFAGMYGDKPKSVQSVLGYEAVDLICRAVGANAVAPEKMKKYLLASGPYTSPLGEFEFDRFGDVNRIYYFYQYSGGQYLDE